MLRFKYLLLTAIAISLFASAGSSRLYAAEPADAATERLNGDPYEHLNKKLFSFNDGLDRYLMQPVARGYDAVTPGPVGRGVTNFFNNLGEPRVVLNDLLQGKVGQAASDTMRFLVNTTLGIGGLFDVAKHLGMKRHNEDFGQTLAVWGVKRSSYFVIPVLGPSSVRDSVGELVDFFTYPLLYYHDIGARNWLYVVRLINRRANQLSASDVLEEAAGDYRYEFVREAYWQNRKNEIYDGNPPLELPYMLEDDPAAAGDPELRP